MPKNIISSLTEIREETGQIWKFGENQVVFNEWTLLSNSEKKKILFWEQYFWKIKKKKIIFEYSKRDF